MAVLRLFAAAREAAGTARADVPGTTVDDVLDAARDRFGPDLGRVIDQSRVWCNGEPAEGADPVRPTDEVAVLPPVSGGAGPAEDDAPRPSEPRRRPTFAPSAPPPSPVRRSNRSPGAEAPSAERDGRDGPRRAPRRPNDQRRRPTPAGRDRRAETPPAGRDRRAEAPPAGRDRRAETDRSDARRAEAPPAGRDRRAEAPPAERDGRDGGDGRDGPRRAPRRPNDQRRRPTPARGRTSGPAPAGDRPAPTPTPPPRRSGTLTRTRSITGAPIEDAADVAPGPTTVVTAEQSVLRRMRSVRVPVTGHVTIRGKQRKVAGAREKRTAFGRRYAVVYDTDGPKVTLGVLWFVAGIGSMVLGWWALTLLFAVVAGWAAADCAERWDEVGVIVDPWVAGLGAGVVAASASMGTGYFGGAILSLVIAAITRMAFAPVAREDTLAAAGTTVACALPFALAGGSVILTHDLEIGAAVVLLILVAAYEAGDYLIGSGASNSIEGPLTGIVTIGVVSMGIAVLSVPPFSGAATFTFAALAAVLCPLGQLAASALLPAADARAPAVRRIDSLLVLAPAWVWLVGLFIDSRGL